MPEIGGSYLLTLDVPGGDNTTDVTLVVRDPLGAETTPGPVDTGAGTSWEAAYGPIDAAGWFVATWTVTGAGQGAKSSRFYVVTGPEAFGVWPPSLADLKLDMGDRDDQDDTYDDRLSMTLDASVAHVRDIKGDLFDLAAVEESGVVLPPPTADLVLGTLRLAARWHARRGTWDNMTQSAVGGTSIVASYDSDIERMLGIARFTKPQNAFA